MRPNYLKLSEIRSNWYSNILEQWHPDPGYIAYLRENIEKKEYFPPILVISDSGGYIIVNGHHRVYAHLVAGEEYINGFILDGTFKDTEPLRKAEVLLKQYDEKTQYKYQFSGYLDRWAATAENHGFINKFQPIYRLDIYFEVKRLFKVIYRKLFNAEILGDKNGRN